MTEPQVQTPAQERFVRDVLAWGEPRPGWPPQLVTDLRSHLEAAVTDVGDALRHAASGRRGATLSIGRRVLERRVCDGWQLEPEPFRHSVASVRATLARDAIAADWERGSSEPTRALVDRVWHEAATRRPGDPSSRSAWLNRRTGDEAEAIRLEVVALVEDLREVWPVLPEPDLLVRDVRRPLEVVLGGGEVTLYGVPDLVLDSQLRDERARALVLDLRTGRPRPERDREALRFHALLVTLARRRPPFRWSSHHVTEGRTESEDLSPDALFAAADQVVEVVRQLARLGRVDPVSRVVEDPVSRVVEDPVSRVDPAVSLAAGPWCADCRRRTTCPIAQVSGDAGS